MDGLINIYKEKGYTSHDVTAIIKRIFKGEKVGHAGTLDPEAEGVLIVLIGKGTKLSDYIMDGDKEYRATVKFGVETTTYDHTGEIIKKCDPAFSEDRLRSAASEFIGVKEQIPPMYSAIKMDGKKLYDLARKGITVERKARNVSISDICVEWFNGKDEAVIYIKCGKGTYVRSICHDLGQTLGCGAHMTALIRTAAGGFKSENGIRINELKKLFNESGKPGLDGALVSLEEALSGFNRVTADLIAGNLIYNGARLKRELLKEPVKIEELNVLYDEAGSLIGIYEAVYGEGNTLRLKPKTMLYQKPV